MLTITIKPLHLAIIAAFAGGIAVAGVALFVLGGGDAAPLTSPTPSTANLDEAPTAKPLPEATQEATAEPTAEPTQEPEPEQDEPEIRSCEEIEAAGTYNSPEERTFFLDECVGGGSAVAPAPATSSGATSPPAPASSGATAQEELYRTRAEGSVNVFAVKIAQYYNTPSVGVTGDWLELGLVMRRFTQELDRLPETPPRFLQAHNQFRASLLSLADYLATFVNVDPADEDEYLSWFVIAIDKFAAMFAALQDYSLVVGFDLPEYLSE